MSAETIQDIYALSPVQQGILFHSVYAPDSGVYCVQLSYRLRGALNLTAFEQAWQAVVARHTVLRTGFDWESIEHPVQIVYQDVSLSLTQYDWQSLDEERQRSRLQAFLREDRQQGFDLEQPPLMRLTLIRLAKEVYQFIWSKHHLILDGWSTAIVLREVIADYQALNAGQPISITPAPPFRDYIAWLQQQDLSQAETFWRDTLKGISAPTPLMRPFEETCEQSPAFNERSLILNSATTDAFSAFCQNQQLTLNTLLQGAWAVLLSRYSGEDDILYGATVAGRPPDFPQAESTVGLFINTLPVRIALPPSQPLNTWLQTLQTQGANIRHYNYTPLVEVQGWSEIPRGVPLFDSIVVFENYPVDPTLHDVQLGFEIEETRAAEQTNYPLTVTIIPGTELTLKVTYDCQRFAEATITQLLTHLHTLLQGMIADPTAPLQCLPLLAQEEQRQLLEEWNQTQTPYPQVSFPELFERQAARTPDAVAAIFEEGRSKPYQALNQQANQLAHYLQQQGVKPGVLVGICLNRSLEMLVGLLAILKAGGAYVPLDPAYPRERLAFMLADARVSVLVTQESLLSMLPEHSAQVVYVDRSFGDESDRNLPTHPQLNDLAYVIYTSGSTGKPKGVQISHRALVNFLGAMQQAPGIHPDDTLLSVTTLSFDIAALELYLPLLVGAKVLIVSREVATDGAKLLSYLPQASVMQATPATWQMLLTAGWQGKSFLKLLSGGEALSRPLANELLARAREVWNMYGPTETTIWSGVHRVQPGTGGVPIGQAIANTTFYVLDAHLRPVPVGVAGELHIGGVGLAQGYLHRPQLTKERFIDHPVSASPLYKTGDLVRYRPDGTLEYLGRCDHQVKLRGFRIELGEIEATLTAHPTVRNGIVVVREVHTEQAQLVAYLVSEPNQSISVSQLRQFLGQRLPNVMIPGTFVVLEALPLTPNGKVNRRSLQLSPEFAPGLFQASEPQKVTVSPRTPIEQTVAEIWQDVLTLETLSIHDNFFELGGHSLLATRILAQLRDRFELELPLRALFETPTVAGLAQTLETLLTNESTSTLPPITPIPRSGTFPLSLAQKRLWFLSQFDPESTQYHITNGVRLQGVLQISALEQSFQALLDRQEVLRSTFDTIEGKPVVKIASELVFTLPVVDIEALPQATQTRQIEQEAIAQVQQPFALNQPPLLRVKLLRLSATEHILLLTLHHLIADGWSLDILVRELAHLYHSFARGTPTTLPELPIQYVDFAAWQHQHFTATVLDEQLAYWRKQLHNAPTLLDLPTDYPRQALNTFRGATHSFTLSPHLTQSLQRLSQTTETTLFMTLLAAFVILLSRYSGTEDLVVGSPIANRRRSELEHLIGFFVNTLVLRTDVSGNPSFTELLERVRKVVLGAYAHQELPFEQLVEALQPQRELSYTPLFQVMFMLQNAAMSAVELPGLSVAPFEHEANTAKFDLTLSLVETETELVGKFEYNRDLFTPAAIARFAGHFQTLIQGICDNPEQPLAQLPLLPQHEQQQLLVDWNATQRDWESPQLLHQLIEAQVQQTPDAVAVSFENTHLTYNQLNQQANQLAHRLQQQGVQPGNFVGLCIERSLEMLISLLAILKTGAAYLPLDPTYPQERLAFMVDDSQLSLLITHSSLLTQLPPSNAPILTLDRESLTQEPTHNRDISLPEDTLAYVIYTSGSTGTPKGVQIPHRAVTNFLKAMQQRPGINAEERLLAVTTLSFDIAVLELFLPLTVGAEVIITPQETTKDGAQLARYLEQVQPTLMQATPATWRLLLAAGWSGNATLKILCGGEALPRELAAQLQQRCASLWNMYGPTETTIWSAVHPVDSHKNLPTLPIGHPIANTEFYVLDADQRPVPIGVPGELYIGGAGLAKGYFHRPQLNEEKFIAHPFDPQQRLYRTGDRVKYLADGTLAFLGRLDNQIKIRGFRIELGEIEATVLQHPQVEACVVVPQPDNSGEQRLVAYGVSAGDLTPHSNDLHQFLQQRLPSYLLPSLWVFLDEFPLTPNGKINRQALPTPTLPTNRNTVAPRTPLEGELVSLWSNLLEIDSLGIHDNFFELGGHSLLATQLIAQLREVFAIDLPLRHLFEGPTIAQLAREIEQRLAGEGISERMPLQRIPRQDDYPLSFAQQRLWFLEQLQPSSTAYLLPMAVRLRGSLKAEVLVESLQKLSERHEALRTGFQLLDGQARQRIFPSLSPELSCRDLQGLPQEEQEAQVEQLLRQAGQVPLKITDPPLLRATLVQLSQEESVLLLTLHHLIADGWSQGILMHDLAAFYESLVTGHSPNLPELPVQYVDYSLWQRQWLQGEVLEAQLNYWCEQLRDAPVLQLPTDHPRPALPSEQGASLSFALSAELSAALQDLARRTGTTLFMTLMAAWKTLLFRYTGQTDLLVGTPVANRQHPAVEGVVGCFVNTLVLRTDASGNPSFTELLEREREVALGAYAHQDLPFERLVEELQLERDLSYSPLFQVMFVLQNVPLPDIELSDLSFETVACPMQSAKFDLTLTMSETSQGLTGRLEYNCDLFEAQTIQRLLGHFQTLIQGICDNPEQPLAQLPLLPQHEQQQLLVDWNATEHYESNATLTQLFAAQVERTPDAVALTFEDTHLTYTQLDQRANQLAHLLQQRGVKPDSLVGLCLDRRIELVVGILGILKAGGGYVPLDTRYPHQRLAYLLEDSQVSVVVTDSACASQLSAPPETMILLDTQQDEIAQHPCDPCQAETTADSLAYVIYTSGSTGNPKGVLVNHRNVVRLFSATESWFHFSEDDVWTLFHSYGFDFSVWELWGALLYGGRLVVVPHCITRSPQGFYQLLSDEQVTVLNQTPSAFQQLMRVEETRPVAESSLALRFVILAGEALALPTLQPWLARHGDRKPELINMYGITETTVHVTYRPLRQVDITASSGSAIGSPIPDLQVYVLDEYQQPVPVGVAGELYVGGAGVVRGYLHQPQLTQERFIPNPFTDSPTERLYRSGDLGRYLANGELEYLGRIDHQVKIRGFRIELGEIEAVLTQHPAVREALVLALPIDAESFNGTGDRQLVAYVVGQGLTPGEFRRFVAQQLPDYMIPAAFVVLDRFPLTPNGKIDRRALPAPSRERRHLAESFVAARSPQEQALTEIWAKVLGLDRVGIHDNFFALGGDSIRTIQVRAQAQKQGLNFSVEQLFQHQTIAELASVLTMGSDSPEPIAPLSPIAPSDRAQLPPGVDDAYPLTPLQLGMLFHNIYNQESVVFHDIFSFHLQAPFNQAVLDTVIQRLLTHHPILRTGFDLTHFSDPLQLVYHQVDSPLAVEDRRSLSPQAQDRVISAWIDTEKQRRFDWQRPPLLRFQVHRRSDETFQFTLSFHHAILDGWSVALLLTELFTDYFETLETGTPPVKPFPNTQFRDFVAQQHQALASPACRTYWQKTLAGCQPTRLTGPTPVATETQVAQTLRVPFSATTFMGLSQLAQRVAVPFKTVLLAAHLRLLGVLTGQSDVLSGVSSNGRPETLDGDRILGLFLNTLPLRVSVSPQGTGIELIEATFAAEQAALPYRRYPLAQIQKDLGQQRLFNVSFNFTHFHVYQQLQTLTPLKVLDTQYFEMTDLALLTHFTLSPNTSALQLLLKFNPAVLSADYVKGISEGYIEVLNHLVAHPDHPLEDLQQKLRLSQAQTARVLATTNAQKLKLARRRRIRRR